MSRGRHRKPTHTGRNLAVISASGAFALPAGVLAAPPAEAGPPGGWGPIISCESGGNARAENPSPDSTASGLFQFLDSTWQSVGGSGRAKNASVAEQYRRAEQLYAQSGTSPWNASKSCWSGKTGATPRITGGDTPARSAPQAKPRSNQQRATTAGGPAGVRAADGTGSYVCGPNTYQFAACDPGDDGQTKQYPAYEGRHRAAAPAVKAASTQKVWPNAPADLHRRDAKGHGTYTCDTAHLGYDACDGHTLGQTVQYPLFDR